MVIDGYLSLITQIQTDARSAYYACLYVTFVVVCLFVCFFCYNVQIVSDSAIVLYFPGCCKYSAQMRQYLQVTTFTRELERKAEHSKVW